MFFNSVIRSDRHCHTNLWINIVMFLGGQHTLIQKSRVQILLGMHFSWKWFQLLSNTIDIVIKLRLRLTTINNFFPLALCQFFSSMSCIWQVHDVLLIILYSFLSFVFGSMWRTFLEMMCNQLISTKNVQKHTSLWF